MEKWNKTMKKTKLYLFIACIILISTSFLFNSCKSKKQLTKNNQTQLDENTIINDNKKEEEESIYKNSNVLNDMTLVNLYFINRRLPKLSIEKRKVLNLPDKQQMLKQVLSVLAHGPLSKLYPSIPPNFSISGVFILGNTAYINIKKSNDENGLNMGGIETEQLLLYSIVNTTLSSNNTLKYVKILLNGEEAETLMGHIDASEILKFNYKIVVPR